MPKEKEDYRPILEELNARFPDKFLLTVTDVAAWLGCGRKTVRDRWPLPKGEHHYTKVYLARRLAR
ncbi:MAG: hypothetical protein IKO91_00595 [Oscillospiraceae bacterium]|nr:hypothetical protein [Oscillospiraceae bacterium]